MPSNTCLFIRSRRRCLGRQIITTWMHTPSLAKPPRPKEEGCSVMTTSSPRLHRSSRSRQWTKSPTIGNSTHTEPLPWQTVPPRTQQWQQRPILYKTDPLVPAPTALSRNATITASHAEPSTVPAASIIKTETTSQAIPTYQCQSVTQIPEGMPDEPFRFVPKSISFRLWSVELIFPSPEWFHSQNHQPCTLPLLRSPEIPDILVCEYLRL